MSETAANTSYKAGDFIFQKGEPGELMYIIKKGTVDIMLGEKLVETLGPDEFFGEMALIDNQPRSANAIARTDCEIEAITAKRFQFRVQEMPFFAIKVMKVMAQRLRNTTERSLGS
ncbi:MAG: cyclic nucleotide-binding domain-containing protein [Candidatus Methylacidiphilales bacterium]|nr:cyclic nucleotide-binding domain-containing protein [Candidatus Methylacidiphilales bacterium]